MFNSSNLYVTFETLIELRENNDEMGRSPFRRWFSRLDQRAAARVAVALERMSEGNLEMSNQSAKASWNDASHSVPDIACISDATAKP